MFDLSETVQRRLWS